MQYRFDNLGLAVREDGFVKTKKGWTRGSLNPVVGYLQVRSPVTGRTYLVHRLVAHAFLVNPNPAVFQQVDHISREKQNNSARNLRWLNRELNCLNNAAQNVTWSARRKAWYVRVRALGVTYRLGTWKNKEEAYQLGQSFKELAFRLCYLSHVTNAYAGRHRGYLHARKDSFTAALGSLGVGIRKRGTVRKEVRKLFTALPNENLSRVLLKHGRGVDHRAENQLNQHGEDGRGLPQQCVTQREQQQSETELVTTV